MEHRRKVKTNCCEIRAIALTNELRDRFCIKEVQQRELLQLIETIIIYKFTQKSREEIQAMLGLGDIRQTRVYQEALEEGEIRGKLKTVPKLLAASLTINQIAEALDLSEEDVRQAAQQQSSN